MKLACALLALAVAGCDTTSPEYQAKRAEIDALHKDADVARYDGESVTITSFFDEMGDGFSQSKDAQPEAARVCALSGKRAEFLGVHEAATPTPSVWSGLTYKNEFEFACL